MNTSISYEVGLYDKIKAYLWMMRPATATTTAVAVFAALFLALKLSDDPFDPLTYFFISFAAFCTTAHAIVHNDIVDLDIDLINAPNRPLPAKILSMREAKIWMILLLLAACTAGLIADLRLELDYPISLFWAFTNAMILDVYNIYIKKMGILGNLVVSYVAWSLFIYADIVINNTLTLKVESVGIFAFFWNSSREVLKDIMDIEGDKVAGMKTIAVRYGAKGGAIVASLLISAAVIWTLPLILLLGASLFLKAALIVLNIIFIYRSLKIIKNPDFNYIYRTKLLYLRLMLLAVIGLSLDQMYALNIL